MSSTISTAFIKQFESEVHMAYQRMGSKLRGTIRTINNVVGSQARFQKTGTGEAVTKSRHGEVPVMDISHSTVDVTLSDYYAADYIDKLDELKTNIDERQVVAQNAAWALGRKTDEQLTTVLDGTSNSQSVGSPAAGLNLAKAQLTFENFGTRNVPDDGDRFWVVGHKQWTNLLDLTQFSSLDYVPANELPYSGGMTAKRWLGFMYYAFSGLPVDGSSDRKTFAYHRSAVGHAIGQDIVTEINYIPEKVAHLTTSMMSMGAVMIDDNGVEEVICDE